MNTMKRISMVIVLAALALPLLADPLALVFVAAQEATPEAAVASDTDEDGIVDEQDPCPDDAGNTCNLPADRDGDGIVDVEDACPGDAENTCNLPPDRDGDGIAGDEDACPDDPANACLAPTETEDAPTATETPTVSDTPAATPDQPVEPADTLVSVGGRVWNDLDGDGKQDAGEPGVTGLMVTLGDMYGNRITDTTTGTDGYFYFAGLLAGWPHTFTVAIPTGYLATIQKTASNDSESLIGSSGSAGFHAPSTGSNKIPPNGAPDLMGLYGGLRQETPSSIGDRVWLDRNKNGLQDELEPAGVAGVTVSLYGMYGGDFYGSTTTDAGGYFSFTERPPGSFGRLVFIAPAGYGWTIRTGAVGDGNNSVVNSSGGSPGVTFPAIGTDITYMDAGLVLLDTPTPTPTNTPTASNTPSGTETNVPTSTPTVTPSNTSIATRTVTVTSTRTATATVTITPVKTSTGTRTPSKTATHLAGGFAPGDWVRTTTWLNQRSGPGLDAPILRVLRPNTLCQVTDLPAVAAASGNYIWYPIRCPGYGFGYVAGTYLRAPNPPAPTATPKPSSGPFVPGDTVKTTTWLNLRKSAGIGQGIVLVLPPNTVCQVTGTYTLVNGSIWYPVSCPGFGSGWVAGAYLKRAGAQS